VSSPSSTPTATSALLQAEDETQIDIDNDSNNKVLVLVVGIVVGTSLVCLAFCVPIVFKDSRNISNRGNSGKKLESAKDEDLLVYERALREMDEEFYAGLRNENVRDERKNDEKRTKKRKADVDHHIEGLTLQERIENIHAESLRKVESKLEFDTVF
jgi:hypothetical protein